MSSGPAILQVIPSLDAGGAERTTIEIAKALTGAGYAALVASEGGRMEPELKAAGGELIRMPVESKSPLRIFANALVLRDVIRKRNVKLVHARSRAPAWSAFFATRMARVPFVTTYHGIYNANNILKRFYNSVMASGDMVIANSQWTADHIRAEHHVDEKRLAVIPRGVDLQRFDPGSIAPDRIAAMRQSWGAHEDDIVITLPGRLTRWKGQLVLINAMARLKQSARIGKARAVLVGDAQGRDDYVSELRNAIAAANLRDVVSIPGHVSDMATAYLASDIVVSASTDPEAFGRVAAEAGAMGRAVIASDHGGARETIVAGETGMLVPPGDAVELTHAIVNMIAMGAASRTTMGTKARAYVAAHFALERMTADTLSLYRSLIG